MGVGQRYFRRVAANMPAFDKAVSLSAQANHCIQRKYEQAS